MSVIGLSHIVFTTDSREFAEGSCLKKLFAPAEVHHFKNQEFKSDLQRQPSSETEIRLFRPLSDDCAALELLFAEGTPARPINSSALLIDAGLCPDLKGSLDRAFPELSALFPSRGHIMDKAAGPVLLCEGLKAKFGTSMGLCVRMAGPADVEAWVRLFGLKLVSDENTVKIATARLMNRSFLPFPFFFVCGNLVAGDHFYNDDQGLSTLGWLAKDLGMMEDASQKSGWKTTAKFPLSLNTTAFNGMFVYDGKMISHEVLTFKK